MSLLLALFGHAGAVAACPLLRDQRTLLRCSPRCKFDPEWTKRFAALGVKISVVGVLSGVAFSA